MAKITLHPMIQSARGKMGNAVFRRSYTGEMTLIKLADMSHVKWSEVQTAHRQRFKEAVIYAKAAMQFQTSAPLAKNWLLKSTNVPMI